MSALFAGKKILFGITGGIAAFKAVEWIRMLKRQGAEVTVVMTESATRFITPLTCAALSGNPVHSGMFDAAAPETIPHITLARESDLLIIAPATANTISKLAHGMADDLLSAIALATRAKVLVFPSMNSNMYLHPATQANLATLRQYNYRVVEPGAGKMACDQEGPGRLPELATAMDEIAAALSPKDLKGQNFLITAGPTHEDLDPVRYLTNRSSGKMGYALARAARQRGASVTLISGPCQLMPPSGVRAIQVRSAAEMHKEVIDKCVSATVVIKSAAVSDFRPANISANKLKKTESQAELQLAASIDILKELGELKKEHKISALLVGFAAESHDHLKEGKRKLTAKNLDLLVLNDILGKNSGFAVDTNQVIILDRQGGEEELPLLSKDDTAHRILDRIASLIIH